MCKLFIGCIGTHANGSQVTSTSELSQGDAIMSNCISAYSETSGGLFKNKNVELKGLARKIIHYLCEGGIEKSDPRDHRLTSLGKSHDAKW